MPRGGRVLALFLGFQVVPALSEEAGSISPREPEASKLLERGRLVRALMRDDALRVDAFCARRDAARAWPDRALDAGAPEEVMEEVTLSIRLIRRTDIEDRPVGIG